MDATAKLEIKPGINHPDHDKPLTEGMKVNLDALSETYGTEINQSPATPDRAHEIDLDQMRQLANQPIETEGGWEGAKEQWDVEVHGKTTRVDGSKGFIGNLIGRMVKQEEQKLKGEDSGSNDNS